MTGKDWILLLVPSLISIIGFICTIYKISKENKNTIKQVNNEIRKALYLNLTSLIDKAEQDSSIVFLKSEFYDKLLLFNPNMKLYATRETMHAFQKYKKYIYQFVLLYENNEKNYYDNIPEEMEDGDIIEVPYYIYSDHICDKYRYEFKQHNKPSYDSIVSENNKLIDALRKDLGTRY